MPYLGYKNPREALASAQNMLGISEKVNFINGIANKVGENILKEKKPYYDMSRIEIEVAMRHIIQTSSSEQEIIDRTRDELGSPYAPDLHTLEALSSNVQTRELCAALGGLSMKNGTLVQLMMFIPDGEIISL